MWHRQLAVTAFAACASGSPGGCCLPVLGGKRLLAAAAGFCLCDLRLPYTRVPRPAVGCVSAG